MSGRKAFKGMAPQGYRIRMMEPGEAEALQRIDAAAGRLLVEAGHIASADPVPLDRFVPFLLRHEIFVAEEKGGGPVGFAAAADLASIAGAGGEDGEGAGCYWLSELSVDPAHGRRGVGSALLAAVERRAGWFFHRAVGLSTARGVAFNELFYAKRGFLSVSPDDLTPALHQRFMAELPEGVSPDRRCVMIRWL
ncbi:GNAT family N-acetyltransferase [Aureimonas sp. AU12]|uniref:GNAT family N-acetyltransferase n=1 Tax=Aureimonas sp. AU12 TaxID=1638161 RepID=UPI000782DF99|nr:GNAT family N-acetyltransferase [Aureimonas sp. AU12]